MSDTFSISKFYDILTTETCNTVGWDCLTSLYNSIQILGEYGKIQEPH